MSGFSDYTAKAALNWVTGQQAMPALASRFLALFTAAPNDAGSGGTEVTGGGYARVQVAGALAAGGAWTTGNNVIALASAAPAWLLALGTTGSGVNVFDATTGQQIGTVSSISGANVTLTGNAANASSGSADSLVFSAFPAASGSAPSSVLNGASVTFATSTADWTNGGANPVIAWGLYDAVTTGNLIDWDYLGGYAWMPATVSAASPGVITAHAHGLSNSDNFIFSTEVGGTAPTFSAGNYTGLKAAAGVATDTLQVTGVNTSASGNGMIRKVASQAIPSGITTIFNANTITLAAA